VDGVSEKRKRIYYLILSLLVCQLVGTLNDLLVSHSVGEWYYSLQPPPLYPPNWIFIPIWNILLVLMGLALYKVWRTGQSEESISAIVWFFFQLTFNIFWVAVFFVMRSPNLALWIILVLWMLAFITWWHFRRINILAGWLLVPYLIFTTYLVYLNWGIFLLNS